MTYLLKKDSTLNEQLEIDKKLINSTLDKFLASKFPNLIWESMRYSALSDGKRIRPILLLESTRICGGNIDNALPSACALEMLHAQSLIHDDLPCMDNDDYRRGRLTNHKVYGEAMAVLAGDALLSFAPQLIIKHTPKEVNRDTLLTVLDEFLEAAGPQGIIGGQTVDINSENKKIDTASSNYLICHKTAELFKFATRAGALLSEAPKELLDALTYYGKLIGYAFQIADDILDVVGSFETLGKTQGKDQYTNKNTHVSINGIDSSKKELEFICVSAQKKLLDYDINSRLLTEIAEQIATKVL